MPTPVRVREAAGCFVASLQIIGFMFAVLVALAIGTVLTLAGNVLSAIVGLILALIVLIPVVLILIGSTAMTKFRRARQ